MSKKEDSTSTSSAVSTNPARRADDYLWVKVYPVESDRRNVQYVLNALMKSLQDADGPLTPEQVYILPRDGERSSSIAVDIHVLRTGKRPPVDTTGEAWKSAEKQAVRITGDANE